MAQWVKDPVWSLPLLRLLLWQGFHPWSHAVGVAKKEKKEKKITNVLSTAGGSEPVQLGALGEEIIVSSLIFAC